MEELMGKISEQDATEFRKLLREGIKAMKKALEQIARDNEEIEQLRSRSAFLIADTRAVLERMERR